MTTTSASSPALHGAGVSPSFSFSSFNALLSPSACNPSHFPPPPAAFCYRVPLFKHPRVLTLLGVCMYIYIYIRPKASASPLLRLLLPVVGFLLSFPHCYFPPTPPADMNHGIGWWRW